MEWRGFFKSFIEENWSYIFHINRDGSLLNGDWRRNEECAIWLLGLTLNVCGIEACLVIVWFRCTFLIRMKKDWMVFEIVLLITLCINLHRAWVYILSMFRIPMLINDVFLQWFTAFIALLIKHKLLSFFIICSICLSHDIYSSTCTPNNTAEFFENRKSVRARGIFYFIFCNRFIK